MTPRGPTSTWLFMSLLRLFELIFTLSWILSCHNIGQFRLVPWMGSHKHWNNRTAIPVWATVCCNTAATLDYRPEALTFGRSWRGAYLGAW